VSIAIRRAELLEDSDSPAANDAWNEVLVYEERLAASTAPDDVTGGVARVGAVRAALKAGRRQYAAEIARGYFGEDSFPLERREAIEKVLREDRERLARRFPALAKRGFLPELDDWRRTFSSMPRVFPLPA